MTKSRHGKKSSWGQHFLVNEFLEGVVLSVPRDGHVFRSRYAPECGAFGENDLGLRVELAFDGAEDAAEVARSFRAGDFLCFMNL
ncbi:MAG: hypothetical protein LBS59_09175 [Puniceicoccales bacterium]|nr:hypothetical protein [Puniceicoccales bacterium]